MLDYEEYQLLGGVLEEVEFKELEPKIVTLFDSYISESIPFWKIKNIDEYGMDLSKAIVEQVDFIGQNGGLQALQGKSDFNIKSVNTSGFSYSIGTSRIDFFHNIPLSPLAISNLVKEMRKSGLLLRSLL